MTTTFGVVIPSALQEQLANFFQSNQDALRGTDIQVVIVSQLSEATVSSHLKSGITLHWITIDQPIGFARTVNLGWHWLLAHSNVDWIGTINDDVVLPTDFFDKLLSALTLLPIASLGGINPIILAPTGSIESAGIVIERRGKAIPLTTVHSSQPFQTDALNGACLFFPRSVIESVGVFDERFESYLEDIELSLRIRRAGLDLWVLPQLSIVHQGHATTVSLLGRRKAWLDTKNWWRIIFKYWIWQDWTTTGFSIVAERGRNLSGVMKAMIG